MVKPKTTIQEESELLEEVIKNLCFRNESDDGYKERDRKAN